MRQKDTASYGVIKVVMADIYVFSPSYLSCIGGYLNNALIVYVEGIR